METDNLFYRAPYGESKALRKGRFGSFFIGLGYCPLTRYSPSLSSASFMEITPWEGIFA